MILSVVPDLEAAPTSRAVSTRWSDFLPPQRQLFDFEPEPRDEGDDEPSVTIEALLGGYGAGKSVAGARKFFKRCAAAAWSPAYGDGLHPGAAAIAPTNRILQKVTIPKVESLIPKDLILSKRKSPYPSITLVNGCEINFVSAESEFEGEDLHTIWCDEIQHEAYTTEKFTNFMMRLRDPHQPTLSMIVTGLPVSGRVRETFDLSQLPENERKNRVTILAGSRDNPYIPRETLEQVMATVPSDQQASLIGGDWMMPQGAVFTTFDNSIHLVDAKGEPNKATSFGLDLGRHGAVVLGQPYATKTKSGIGVRVVDEVLLEDLDAERACLEVKARGWLIMPSKSEIYTDPTIRPGELSVLRRHFPGVHIKTRDRDDTFYYVEEGIRHFQAQLRNAYQETHFQICKHLAGNKFGIVDAIVNTRRHERSGSIVKDDSRDHALDAARYLVCGMIEPKRGQPTARPR